MQGLLNPVTILLHMFNTVVLFAAIYFLLYRPVKRFLENRRLGIVREIDDAHALRKDADEFIAQSRARQSAAFMDSVNKAAKIQEQAEENAKRIVEAARIEADRILKDAQKAADEAVESHKREMREFAAEMAVEISAKILGREITGEDHSRLINEFLEGVN